MKSYFRRRVNKGFKLFMVAMLIFSVFFNTEEIKVKASAQTKTKIVDFSSTSRNQSKVVNIPNLKSITNATTNNGTVTTSINGDNVTVNVSNGSGYSVQTGSYYVPPQSPTYQTVCTDYYAPGGQFGYRDCDEVMVSPGHGGYYQPTYTTYYDYRVTLTYIDNSNPTLNVSITDEVRIYSEQVGYTNLSIEGSFNDADVGDIVNLKYTINNTSHNGIIKKTITSNGSENMFNEVIDVSGLAEGAHTIVFWSEDNKGGKSSEVSFSFKIDKTKPVIRIDGVTDGVTHIDEVLPEIIITDDSHFTEVTTLNGEPYELGTVIDSTGEHRLTVEATDQVGNSHLETITFSINKTPIISQNLAEQTLLKFDELSFDLRDFFMDIESDELTFSVESSEPSHVKATIDGSILTINALKQMPSDIKVVATDQYSSSQPNIFRVNVNTRVPVLEFTEPKLILSDKDKTVTIHGTVKDEDIDDVEITSVIDGKEQKSLVHTTGEKDPWALSWNGSDLSIGVYSHLEFFAKDDFGGQSTVIFPKTIVQVKGSVEDFLPHLEQYSTDLSTEIEDLTVTDHENLLEAFIAVTDLDSTLNPSTITTADIKISALEEGTLKTNYQNTVDAHAMNYVHEHLADVTKEDLVRIGMMDVDDLYIAHYRTKLLQYKEDLEVLSLAMTRTDIQNIINVVNGMEKAKTDPLVVNWTAAKRLIEILEVSVVRSEELLLVEEGILKSLESDSSQLTISVLEDEFGIESKLSYLPDYQLYLGDVVKTLTAELQVEDLRMVVNTIDQLKVVYHHGLENPSKEAVDKFLDYLNELVDGAYKDMKSVDIVTLSLKHLVTNPKEQDTDNLDRLGLIYKEENFTDYLTNIEEYIRNKGKEAFTIEDAQNVIIATDKYLTAIQDTTDENILDAIEAIGKLGNDSSLAKRLEQELVDWLIQVIGNNPSQATLVQLEQSFERIIEQNLQEYRDALVEYEKDFGPLTKEVIQKVIDAINSVIAAEQNISSESITQALNAVVELEEGRLKESLLERIREVAIELVKLNPSDVTVIDLERTGVTGIQPEYLEFYQDSLAQHQSALSEEEIQKVIDLMNQFLILMKELTDVELEKFVLMTEALLSSSLKDDMVKVIVVVKELQTLKNEWETSTIPGVEQGISIISNQSVKASLDQLLGIMKSILEAHEEPTRLSIQKAETLVGTTPAGTLQKDLSNKLVDVWFKLVLLNLDSIKPLDLIKAGIENIKAAFIEDYSKDLQKYTAELERDLTKVEVQLVINVVNSVKEAKKVTNYETVDAASKFIKDLEEGKYKQEYQSELGHLRYMLLPLKDRKLDTVANNPSGISTDDLVQAGIQSVNSSLIPKYQKWLSLYLQEQGTFGNRETLRNQVQKIINMVNQMDQAETKPSYTNIDRFEKSTTNLNDGVVKETLQGMVNEMYFELVSINPNGAKSKILNQIGLIEIQESNIKDYLNGLQKYVEHKTKLTLEDMQQIINIVNSIVRVEKELTASTLDEATLLINRLPNGILKNGYLERIMKLQMIINPNISYSHLQLNQDDLSMNVTFKPVSTSSDPNLANVNIEIQTNLSMNNATVQLYSVSKASTKTIAEFKLGKLTKGNSKQLSKNIHLGKNENVQIGARIVRNKSKIETDNKMSVKSIKKLLFIEKSGDKYKKRTNTLKNVKDFEKVALRFKEKI